MSKRLITAAILGIGVIAGHAWAERSGAPWRQSAAPEIMHSALSTGGIGTEQELVPIPGLNRPSGLTLAGPLGSNEAPLRPADGSESYQEVGALPHYG